MITIKHTYLKGQFTSKLSLVVFSSSRFLGDSFAKCHLACEAQSTRITTYHDPFSQDNPHVSFFFEEVFLSVTLHRSMLLCIYEI